MKEYDIVLIDSRTGVTEMGGICTAQLPDAVVMLFTANAQSLSGTIDVARRAIAARDRLPYDRAGLVILPVPGRFDAREEFKMAKDWERRFADELRPLVAPWLNREVPIERLLGHVTIPYVPYWSFGEGIVFESEQRPSPGEIGYSIEAIASIISHRFGRTELLADSRDSYVAAASRGPLDHESGRMYQNDVLLTYSTHDSDIADACRSSFRRRELRILRVMENDVSNTMMNAVGSAAVWPRYSASSRAGLRRDRLRFSFVRHWTLHPGDYSFPSLPRVCRPSGCQP